MSDAPSAPSHPPPPASRETRVAELESLRASFGAGAGGRKLAVIAALEGVAIEDGELLVRLHETLLFIRAYADSRDVAAAAERALRGLARRVGALGDTERERIDETGIAGTSIYSAYSLPVVRGLRDDHGREVSFYADADGTESSLSGLLAGGLLPAETEATYDGYVEPAEWLAAARRARAETSDLDRILALAGRGAPDARTRDLLWDALGLSIRWDLGNGTGSRTRARAPRGAPGYQTRPFDRSAVDVQAEVAAGPLPVKREGRARARAWLAVCRDVLAARFREVHTYNHGSPHDVAVADAGEGLRIALVGVRPEARHAVRAFVGYLLVKNDVPIGYGDAVLLLDWGEINFHVFDTFRQAESARTYAAVLRLFRHRFGTRFVFLNRYQFGHHNEDAIRSGAFWFYAKLGFRPHAPGAVRIFREETAAIAADPRHRTKPARLRALARDHMDLVLAPGPEGEALARVLCGFHPMTLGLAVTRAVERRFAGDRVRAERECTARLRTRLGGRWDGAEGAALARLAPLLECGLDLDAWSRPELGSLARIVRAKAAASERAFVLATAAHARLRDAILRLGGAGRTTPAVLRRLRTS